MQIENVSEPIIAVRRSQYPEDKKAEFLLVGRSNVGKSSFINTVVNRKNLARVSATPGKTQTLNFYNVNDSFYLVDVPGYGYALTSKEQQKKFGLMIEEYLEKRAELRRVFMLVDFRHKPTEDDLLMYNFLKYYHVPVTIVATKVDKVNSSKKDTNYKALTDSLDLVIGDDIVLFSSVTKLGRDEIIQKIDDLTTEIV